MSNAKVRITFLPTGVQPESVGCGAVYNPSTRTLIVPASVTPYVLISFFDLHGVEYTNFEPVSFEFSGEATHGRSQGGRG